MLSRAWWNSQIIRMQKDNATSLIVSFFLLEYKKSSWVGFWDAKERECGLSLEDAEARGCAVEDFNKWVDMEDTFWNKMYESGLK